MKKIILVVIVVVISGCSMVSSYISAKHYVDGDIMYEKKFYNAALQEYEASYQNLTTQETGINPVVDMLLERIKKTQAKLQELASWQQQAEDYEEAGKYYLAKKEYQKILEVHPWNIEIKKRVSLLDEYIDGHKKRTRHQQEVRILGEFERLSKSATENKAQSQWLAAYADYLKAAKICRGFSCSEKAAALVNEIKPLAESMADLKIENAQYNNFNRAISDLEMVLNAELKTEQAKNKLAELYYLRGLAYFREEDLEKSIEYFKLALKYNATTKIAEALESARSKLKKLSDFQ